SVVPQGTSKHIQAQTRHFYLARTRHFYKATTEFFGDNFYYVKCDVCLPRPPPGFSATVAGVHTACQKLPPAMTDDAQSRAQSVASASLIRPARFGDCQPDWLDI
ncbi:hypothetical protein, partial [Paraburkholderia atlantica]|uniref:hypothetical protein n=1 Tax=Paraburkholderia atlantica TaxID=2654982 RepID=UPI001C841EB4